MSVSFAPSAELSAPSSSSSVPSSPSSISGSSDASGPVAVGLLPAPSMYAASNPPRRPADVPASYDMARLGQIRQDQLRLDLEQELIQVRQAQSLSEPRIAALERVLQNNKPAIHSETMSRISAKFIGRSPARIAALHRAAHSGLALARLRRKQLAETQLMANTHYAALVRLLEAQQLHEAELRSALATTALANSQHRLVVDLRSGEAAASPNN